MPMKPRLTAWRGLSRATLLLAVPLLWAGCTHYVGRGSDLYFQGRYIEAAHVLEMSEMRLAEATSTERAEYGLYRGATLWRLGDLEGARRWLEYCHARALAHPKALSVEQQVLLDETLIAVHADLDRRAAARGF
jgi:hypothetical protein